MENADPEIQQLDAVIEGEVVHVTGEVRCVRSCAECGTELKELNITLDNSIDITELSGYKELSEEDRTFLQEVLADEAEAELEVTVEESGAEIEEGGGGRLKKNMLTTRVTCEITLMATHPSGTSLTVAGQLEIESENAASEFDECC